METAIEECREKATEMGIEWDEGVFMACFGKGSYRWLINAMGIGYGDGMKVGLFNLHQHYERSDLEALNRG